MKVFQGLFAIAHPSWFVAPGREDQRVSLGCCLMEPGGLWGEGLEGPESLAGVYLGKLSSSAGYHFSDDVPVSPQGL